MTKGGPRRPGARRGRRECTCVPPAARGVPQDGRGLRPQFIPALVPGEGPAALHPRRTIADLCARLDEIGERDTQVQLLRAATTALWPIDKAQKWFVTRGDLDYTALWILYAATPLAQVEVIGAGLLADREVIPQAMKLNPAFFKTIYTDLLNSKKTREERAGGAGRRRSLHGGACGEPVRAGDRPPPRGRRGAVVPGDREPFQAELRRRAA